METFLTEHGGIIVSALVSAMSIAVIVLIMTMVGNMNAYALSEIIGG